MIVHADRPRVLRSRVEKRRQRRLVRAAVERACAAFERSEPQWAESLFDRYFIGRTVLPWLTAPQPGSGPLTPRLIAAAWAAEVCPQPARQEALLIACLPVAATFLRLLQEQLASVQTTVPIVLDDNAALPLTRHASISVAGGSHA